MPMFQQGLSGPLGSTAQFNNSVQYISPSVKGLQAKLLVGTLEYTMDTRLFAGVTYDTVKIAGAAVGLPTKPSVDLVTTQAGITYRFDAFKLHGYLIRSKPDGAPGMKGTMVGVTSPVSATGVIASSLQRSDAQDAANSDSQTIALQYSHNFSKRTVAYVGMARQSNKGAATYGVWPSRLEAGPSPAGAEVSGYQIGMRHYF
jgi:predicted porin